MSMIWNLLKETHCKERVFERLFLVVNVVAWSVVGFLLWLVARNFVLKTADWAVCFVGYFGIFAGFIGGIIYLWNKK